MIAENFLVVFLGIYIVIVFFGVLSHAINRRILMRYEKDINIQYTMWDDIWKDAQSKKSGRIPDGKLRKLRSPLGIIHFKAFLDKLSSEEQQELLIKNSKSIIDQGRWMGQTNKTFLAFILSVSKITDSEGNSPYGPLLLEYVDQNSAYLRENALRCIYRIGEPQLVQAAFVQMFESGKVHSNRLIGEGLVTYTGDKRVLYKTLMDSFSRISSNCQGGLITAMTADGVRDYDDFLKDILVKHMYSTDTRCTILRHLSVDHSEENGRLLADYILEHEDTVYWESITVAASGLGKYGKTDHIMDALIKALTSSRWIVRHNAAIALCRLGLSDAEIDRIHGLNDRYANDALNFALAQN